MACFMGETWARFELTKPKTLISMVGGRGIEPLTPSMSRKCPVNVGSVLRIHKSMPFIATNKWRAFATGVEPTAIL